MRTSISGKVHSSHTQIPLTSVRQSQFWLATLVLVSTLFFPNSLSAQGPWRFKVGDKYDVNFDQQSMVTTEYNLIQRKLGTAIRLEMGWDVTGVNAKSEATIAQTIKRIVVTMSTPLDGGNVNEIIVDSDLDEVEDRTGKEMFKQIKPLVGATFDVTMNSAGEILEVTLTDATKKTIREASGSMRLRDLLTPDGLREMFGQSLVILNQDTYTNGETWNRERSAETSMGTFTLNDGFTYEGSGEAEESALGKFSVDTQTNFSEPAEDNASEFLTSSGKGELQFDFKNGHFVSSEFENSFSFTRKYRDSAINTETTSSTTMTMVKY